MAMEHPHFDRSALTSECGLTDAELASRLRGGDTSALEEIYRRYGDEIFSTALRILASPVEAEDILQDVFVGLARSLDRYCESGSFGAWLRRVAVRTALMSYRQRVTRARVESRGASVSTAAPRDPADVVAARSLILGLPDKLRVVFLLKEIEGYSHVEIGALLGISANASTLRLRRAWQQIRKKRS